MTAAKAARAQCALDLSASSCSAAARPTKRFVAGPPLPWLEPKQRSHLGQGKLVSHTLGRPTCFQSIPSFRRDRYCGRMKLRAICTFQVRRPSERSMPRRRGPGANCFRPEEGGHPRPLIGCDYIKPLTHPPHQDAVTAQRSRVCTSQELQNHETDDQRSAFLLASDRY